MKIIYICLLLCFCAFVGKGWYLVRDGLVVRRVLFWESPSLELGWNEEAQSALKQRFYSLSNGRQSYAFVSEDGRYVIKIPRSSKYQLPLWLRALNVKALNFYRGKRLFKKQTGKEALLQSFRIAFGTLKEETAIVAVRFPGEKGRGEVVKIADHLGRFYELPLEKTGFVLQYKKELFVDLFKKDSLEIATRLDQFLELIAARARKGIICRDETFKYNYGFDQNGVYQIDVGDFLMSPNAERSIQISLGPIREWVEKFDPHLLTQFDQKVGLIMDLAHD